MNVVAFLSGNAWHLILEPFMRATKWSAEKQNSLGVQEKVRYIVTYGPLIRGAFRQAESLV